ncbi:MAG TPA: DUF1501 domain-containing protein, partial [Myxococcota bacterium]|nr:DUF1501 domain-containing protein [Myxococcota bacterium]
MAGLSRRQLLGLGAAGLLLPSLGATVAASKRRFLFIHCYGGWDTTRVFQTNFGSSIVDMEPDAVEAEVGGIHFVDHPDRPQVRAFFENYADRSCIMNGIEVRSVTHERCARIAMTGSAEGQADDWAAILAGRSPNRYLLPYFVLNGTAFTAAYTDRVVRVGADGQLGRLLNGSILGDNGFRIPSSGREAAVEAYVRARMEAATGPTAAAAARALEDLAALRQEVGDLGIGSYRTGCQQLPSQLSTIWDVFERGLARSALMEYRGWCDQGWDSHSNNDWLQSSNYAELFELLRQGISDLDRRSSVDGGSLADEVVVVLFSEMGRTPQQNSAGGRDHWTFTSALLFGAG